MAQEHIDLENIDELTPDRSALLLGAAALAGLGGIALIGVAAVRALKARGVGVNADVGQQNVGGGEPPAPEDTDEEVWIVVDEVWIT